MTIIVPNEFEKQTTKLIHDMHNDLMAIKFKVRQITDFIDKLDNTIQELKKLR